MAHPVLIDITRLADRAMQGRLPTGVDRVSLEYLRHFLPRQQGVIRFAGRWIVLSPKDSVPIAESLLSQEKSLKPRIRAAVARALTTTLWRRGSSAKWLVNTGHSGLEAPDYARQMARLGAKGLFFVHDLIPLTHPEYCRAGEDQRHARRVATMLSAGQALIANSQATLDALKCHATRQGLPMPPASVAWLAPAKLPAPLPQAPLPQPYFVILGTIEPRKNHAFLLQVWRMLCEQGSGAPLPKLLVIGQRGWECENAVDLLERCPALQAQVVERGSCSDEALATALHHAQALLFPSFAEGFGMPLVEALLAGTPVIASDLPTFREIAGAIPDYLSPLDGSGWLRYIADYAQGGPLAQAQRARLTAYAAPTWEQHFAQVEALMEQAERHG